MTLTLSTPAFLSYCREDSEFALKLAGDLKAAGASVWVDQLDIVPGERWDRAVEDALARCARLVVIFSPASVNSTNVMDEVSFALEENKAVIPIIYRDCTLPFRLRRVQYADFRQDYARTFKELLRTLAPGQIAEQRSSVENSSVSNLANEVQSVELGRLKDERRKGLEETRREEERHRAAEQAIAAQEPTRAVDEGRIEGEDRKQVDEALLKKEHEAGPRQASPEHEDAADSESAEATREMLERQASEPAPGSAILAALRRGRGAKSIAVWIAVLAIALWGGWQYMNTGALLTLTGHLGRVTGVAVTPDGRRAVSVSWDETLAVWDLQSGRQLSKMGGSSFGFPVGSESINGLNGVALTQDGKRAVSASYDYGNELTVWDLDAGRQLRTLSRRLGHDRGWWQSRVSSVAVSSDGDRAISASNDHTLAVWGLKSGLFSTLKGHTGPVNGVVMRPDGRSAVSASADNTLKIWDLETALAVRTLSGHSAGVTCVAVSSDWRLAVSGSLDGTLKIWDLEDGREIHTLVGHAGFVSSVAVTSDWRRAVSASDRTLKVWDLYDGRELRTLTGHSGPVLSVAMSPDGRRVVSASEDKTVRVWDLGSAR